MSFKVIERSFGGKTLRPRPEVYNSENGSLLVVATPWGPRSGARKVIENVKDFYLSARTDQEMTSPFQYLTCISPAANHLRVALMLANDYLYRDENKDEYQNGVELFAASLVDQEIIWVNIGYPQVFLKRTGHTLLPLGGNVDLTLNYSKEKMLPPLPQNLLGLAQTSNFAVQSFRPQAGDKILLLSRSRVCPALFLEQDLILERLSDLFVQDDPEMPFWVGLAEI